MDTNESKQKLFRRKGWKLPENIVLVTTYIFLFIVTGNCQTVQKEKLSHIDSSARADVKKLENKLDSSCHNCQFSNSNNLINPNTEQKVPKENNFLLNVIDTVSRFSEKYVFANNTEKQLQNVLEKFIDNALKQNSYELFDGVEIKAIDNKNKSRPKENYENNEVGRALFSSYTYEYRLFQKIKNFIDTHILSINLPKAARLIGFRSFGLKKFFLPLLIGAQVFKSILLAMFLPSILGSFGKILGKGISQISATSSQASYPPANGDDQTAYNNDNKDFMGYETNPAATYAYQDELYGNTNDVNDLSNIDMSRFGVGGQKVSYLPSKNSYYKNQMSTSNNYKIFQKIPASSMILSNYDPFYSPLLSRLDGIFARLGLVPTDTVTDESAMIGGQSLSDVKLESCREQLICLMYNSPAKYAPYSNLVSAQLSRELNELRRPVSDNPEILRFFRYMRAARRGQEGEDCIQTHPACSVSTPSHTMISAYHDINKLQAGHKTIIVGYSNGTTAQYDLHSESPLLMDKKEDIVIYYPYYDEKTHNTCVTGVTSFPLRGASLAGSASPTGADTRGAARAGARLRTHLACSAALHAPHWPALLLAENDCIVNQAVNELDWWCFGRRLGAMNSCAGCLHCGVVAAYSPPAIKTMRPHPVFSDLHKDTVAIIHMVSLNKKKSKQKNDDFAVKLEPLTYKEVTKSYGVELLFAKDLDKKQLQNLCNKEPCPERFPLSDIPSMAFNPSSKHHRQLAMATHSGFIFFINV